MRLPACLAIVLFGVAACGGDPPPQKPVVQTVTEPSLAVSPDAVTLTAGDPPVTLQAVLAGAQGAISWTLDGPGTLSAATGESVHYTPPASVDAETPATLHVASDTATATVTLSILPVVTELTVDPEAGSDANPGTSAAPLQTLKKALSVARAGQRVLLTNGLYSAASGEEWPAHVPPGVALESLTPAGAVLSGAAGQTALVFDGDGSAKDVAIKGFATAVSATDEGAVQLEGLSIDGGGLRFGGQVQATLSAVSVLDVPDGAHAISVFGIATLEMTGGTLSGAGDPASTSAGGLHAGQSAQATLTGVTITHFGGDGIEARESASVQMTNGTVTQTGPTAFAGAQVVLDGAARVTLQDTAVKNGNQDGFLVYDSANLLTLNNVTLDTHPGVGVGMQGGRLDLEGGSVAGCQLGLFVRTGSSAQVKGVMFLANTSDIVTEATSHLSVRGSTFYSAAHALQLDAPADLGTLATPGYNSFEDTQELTVTAGTVTAVGNTWVANQQGADASGQYAHQTVSGPVSGTNFTLDSGATLTL